MIFRLIEESDKPLIKEWIDSDPDHKGRMTEEFFFTPGTISMALGSPGLFVRMDPEDCGTLRLHIQFGPDFILSGKTLLRGWPTFLERIKASKKISRIIFESTSEHLIGFCKRCFGFSNVPGTNDYELFIKES